MDTLSLRKYNRHGILVDDKTNSMASIHAKEFFEFFINDKPLSGLLSSFYNLKGSILDNWIGVLGSSENTNSEIIKLKQLLGKTIADKEIRQVYPASWTSDEFQWYLDKTREELSNPEIIIYCCAECGDYDCGGIAITIDKKENLIIWTIKDNDLTLTFSFDKYQYYEVFGGRLKYLQAA